MRQFRVSQFRLTTSAIVLVVLSLAASVVEADTGKNQIVKHWAKFKPGSSVTLASTITAGNFSIQMEKKEVLVEVTDDKVTVDTTLTTNVGGQARSNPPTRSTVSTSVNQGDWTEVGHEKIEAAGKTLDCTVVEGKSSVPSRGGAQTDTKAKLWVCDEVPGGIVQIVANANGHDVIFKLTAFEVK